MCSIRQCCKLQRRFCFAMPLNLPVVKLRLVSFSPQYEGCLDHTYYAHSVPIQRESICNTSTVQWSLFFSPTQSQWKATDEGDIKVKPFSQCCVMFVCSFKQTIYCPATVKSLLSKCCPLHCTKYMQ